jgi:hypothetical protein
MTLLWEKRPGETPKRRPLIATRQPLQVPTKILSWLDQYFHRDSAMDVKHKDQTPKEKVICGVNRRIMVIDSFTSQQAGLGGWRRSATSDARTIKCELWSSFVLKILYVVIDSEIGNETLQATYCTLNLLE